MTPNSYTSEYLLNFSEERKLFQDENDLINGLKLNKNIKITIGDKSHLIEFNERKYELDVKKIKSRVDVIRNYLIKISTKEKCDSHEEKICFRDLNSEVIETIKELQHSQLNTLRDDLSTEFSIESYKHIHEIENKMRKLITIFMSIKVGLEWVSSNTPKDVIDSIKNPNDKKDTQSLNTFLSDTDFIQLSKFLFDKYSTLKVNDVHRILSSKKKAIDIEQLMEFIPQSNWQRYFAPDIDGDNKNSKIDEQIIDAWEMLYDLRNKIAHNRFISYEDKQKIIAKKEEVNSVIDDALSKIDNIEVTNEQKNEITSELKSTIKEELEVVATVEENIPSSPNEKLMLEAEQTIKKLTKYIYMDISEHYKKELRRHRNNLNRAIENFRREPSKQLGINMLDLELIRSKKYLLTLKDVI
ncbi:HEPN domain-containing protein [Limnobaculum xujianqingii]|uniref:HEPN domain-containing protein n=1 Tax=Limnobaculum xujianqingii TaxID=2738837 RepID=UPI0015BC5F2D|nr:HEPN domain-containing protein [Limnobaculum xujianqingii]